MAHVYILNRTPTSSNHAFSMVWALSRAMKKAGWKYLASSDGSTKEASATPNPFDDKWGPGGIVPGQTGAAANITTKALDDLTITGLTGMTTDSVGNFLTFTGAASGGNNATVQIVRFVSANSVVVRNASGVASDANNGSISWTERNPLLDTYPAFDATAAWWVAQGPTTIQIPINVQPVGFIRGEKVTQATTLAEGELLGVVWNTSSTSYLIILPRVGTFNGSDLITGAISSTTSTPSGSVVTFVEEVVFAKSSADILNGWIFSQRINTTTENAQRFSVIAQSSATGGIAPGNSTAGNAFPTIAFAVRGTPNGSASNWLNRVTNTSTGEMGIGRGHLVAANAIGNPGVSPDGTFWWAQAMPGQSSFDMGGFAHMRMDDTEVGDVDPFVWIASNNGGTRTAAPVNSAPSLWSAQSASGALWSSSSTAFPCWRRRGYGGSGDTFLANCYMAYIGGTAGNLALMTNSSDPDKVASHTGNVFVREPLWIINTTVTTKTRKGTCRWFHMIPTGATLTTWENKTWVAVSTGFSTTYATLLLGPWDGTTDPVYA